MERFCCSGDLWSPGRDGKKEGRARPLEVNPALSNWYYTSAKDYVGGDSFTWKVNDGVVDSNVGTVTITVNPSVPVPQDQTVCVKKDTATDIAAAYRVGGTHTRW